MYKKYLISATCLVFMLGLTDVHAQFEGHIVFDTYRVSDDGSREQNDRFTMSITPDRLLLRGENQYNTFGSIQSEGILVRLDEEDFVFLNGENTALRISRQDITSMMNMFSTGSSAGNVNPDDELSYEMTGEARTINGYRTEKFIFRDEDNSEDYAAVWMTRELDINWGMMAESWGNEGLDAFSDALPLDLIFVEGYFPLQMEAYEGGELREITEVREIMESNVADEEVEVPAGVNLMNFQEYLFSRMSGN